MPDPALLSLHVYPLKSAAGIAVERWSVDDFGLRFDRRWMVIDDAGDFMTQRNEPRLALIRTAITNDALELAAPGVPALRVPLHSDGKRQTVAIWSDRVRAERCGRDADEWLSAFLGRPVSLVHMPDDTRRQVDLRYAKPGERTSFSDGFPFLLIGQASLDDLNGRMIEPLPMNRFRPNIVITGSGPYEEDRWDRIATDDVAFRVVKPCGRCVVTTTNQLTAERGVEPLRTLATYRRRHGKVIFGQNLVHEGPGELVVGSPVRVISLRAGS